MGMDPSLDTPEDRGLPAFAAALDAAVAARALAPAEIRRRVANLGTPISEATLRFWRQGRRRPEHGTSLEAISNLEQVLGLRSGALAMHLGPTRRLRRSRWEEHDELVGEPGALAPLLESIGCADMDDVESLGGTLVVDLDENRRVRSTSNRMLWKARVDGARRVRATLHVDTPTPHPPSASVTGATIGRHAWDPSTGWAAWELVLPRPLMTGETTMLEWHCADALDDEEVTCYESVAERRVVTGGLWVRFHGEIPTHVERFEDTDDGLEQWVTPVSGTSVEHHVQNFGPGVFGMRWEW